MNISRRPGQYLNLQNDRYLWGADETGERVAQPQDFDHAFPPDMMPPQRLEDRLFGSLASQERRDTFQLKPELSDETNVARAAEARNAMTYQLASTRPDPALLNSEQLRTVPTARLPDPLNPGMLMETTQASNCGTDLMLKLRNMDVLDENDLRQLGATPHGEFNPGYQDPSGGWVPGGDLLPQNLQAQLRWMESQGRKAK